MLQHDAYLWAESGYRQSKLLAEAEDHRLRRLARKARRAEREQSRRQAAATGSGARSRLTAAVIQLTPRSRRHEPSDSRDRAA